MLVLDTDVLSLIQRGAGPGRDRLVERLGSVREGEAHVTIATVEEQMRGWLAYLNAARTPERLVGAYKELHVFVRGLQLYPILDFDAGAAQRFDQLKKLRTRVGTMDLRIAAIALAHSATVISRNLTDYLKVPGLRVEDWTALDPPPCSLP